VDAGPAVQQPCSSVHAQYVFVECISSWRCWVIMAALSVVSHCAVLHSSACEARLSLAQTALAVRWCVFEIPIVSQPLRLCPSC
jgi:hypothetical protein